MALGFGEAGNPSPVFDGVGGILCALAGAVVFTGKVGFGLHAPAESVKNSVCQGIGVE